MRSYPSKMLNANLQLRRERTMDDPIKRYGFLGAVVSALMMLGTAGLDLSEAPRCPSGTAQSQKYQAADACPDNVEGSPLDWVGGAATTFLTLTGASAVASRRSKPRPPENRARKPATKRREEEDE